jgi:hypothetical protein
MDSDHLSSFLLQKFRCGLLRAGWQLFVNLGMAKREEPPLEFTNWEHVRMGWICPLNILKYTSIHHPAISRISNEWCNSRSCRFLVETKPMVKSLSVESKMAPIVFGEADHGSIRTVLGWETIESNSDVITPWFFHCWYHISECFSQWEDMFLMGCCFFFRCSQDIVPHLSGEGC